MSLCPVRPQASGVIGARLRAFRAFMTLQHVGDEGALAEFAKLDDMADQLTPFETELKRQVTSQTRVSESGVSVNGIRLLLGGPQRRHRA